MSVKNRLIIEKLERMCALQRFDVTFVEKYLFFVLVFVTKYWRK